MQMIEFYKDRQNLDEFKAFFFQNINKMLGG